MEPITEVIANASSIFGAIFAAGAVYMLVSIFLGGAGDADMGGLDVGGTDADLGGLDAGVDADAGGDGEAVGISLNLIAVFAVGFGGMGLAGTVGNWPWLLTLLLSVLFGLVLGRGFQRLMRFLLRRDPDALPSERTLVGKRARITVDTPAGQLGEALIIDGERIKYAVRNNDADEPLHKGDIVSILSVANGRLTVRRTDSDVEMKTNL